MIVRVKLFAAAREVAGTSEVTLDTAGGATLADVERALLHEVPALAQITRHARWAVDAEFTPLGREINADSQIALIPPVSGG
jgi:sulfur-carrier protein